MSRYLKPLARALAGDLDAAARPYFETTAWEGANPPRPLGAPTVPATIMDVLSLLAVVVFIVGVGLFCAGLS